MRAAIAAPVVASALCLITSAAGALSLGSATNGSRLGQPLDFAVALKLDANDTLSAQCIRAEVSAGDTRIPAARVRARLVRSGASNDAVVRISTSVRVNEPVVTVALSLGCPAQLTHKFVSLLDPPPSRSTSTAPAGRAEALKPAPSASAATPAATPPQADAAASAASTDADPLVRDRVLVLEERLEHERQDNQAAQQSIAALQARLRELEQARHNDPAIYGLWTLVVLLAAAIAVLLWRFWRLQSQQAWAKEAQALSEQIGPHPTGARRMSTVTPPLDEATMTSMRVLSEPSRTTVPGDADAVREDSRATLPPTARVRRALSAEELIDLEQQADFFIVLGQEDAAIDLLMGHVRSSGGTSPMPYLKLLEIYRRRSDADAYDRIRERFNRRFNGQAPAWDDAPKDSRSLDDHPEVQARVQAQWKTPARAVELLEALLFRRDASAGPFDLPAYEDLLFLYAVARDHLEREVNPDGVDLLLPIGNEEQVSSIQHAETRPPEAWMQSPPSSVDLELDLDASRRARR